MTTPRRSFLSALALAPLVGAVSAVPAAALPVDSDRSEADWLEHGSRNADPAFAALCAEALHQAARSRISFTLYQDAAEAAEAATPEFPPALVLHCCQRDAGGAITREWRERWSPEMETKSFMGVLPRLAHREAQARGIPYSKSLEADLRALFDDWSAAREQARADYMVSELAAACDAATDLAGDALSAVFDYRPRNADALLVKMRLLAIRHSVDCDGEGECTLPSGCLPALISDVARVLAS
jgi:hypothetical protein